AKLESNGRRVFALRPASECKAGTRKRKWHYRTSARNVRGPVRRYQNRIDPADFQRLFQPYFSTKGRGTGLGLAIVNRTVTEHGGKIKVVANLPKGAKFIIELPVTTS